MRVTVHFMAQLKKAAGTASMEIDVEPGSTIAALIEKLALRDGAQMKSLLLTDDGMPQPSLLVFIGDEQAVPLEHCVVRDGDVLTILTPMAGG